LVVVLVCVTFFWNRSTNSSTSKLTCGTSFHIEDTTVGLLTNLSQNNGFIGFFGVIFGGSFNFLIPPPNIPGGGGIPPIPGGGGGIPPIPGGGGGGGIPPIPGGGGGGG